MHNNFVQRVYDTLQGTLVVEACVPGVACLFADGTVCDRMYEDILAAYDRLLRRLEVQREDPDLEVIMNSFLVICREMGLHMYDCGAKFGSK